MLNDLSITLDYEGEVPDLKYFYHPDPLNKTAYTQFSNDYKIYKATHVGKWNLKNELVKYCEQDVVSLHNVISIFTKEIYNKFNVNILKSPTLASIAFKIFRSCFILYENIL